MSDKNDPLLIAAIAVVGYMMLSRNGSVRGTGGGYVLPSRAPTSLPGSVGTGTAQAVGGALGYIIQHIPSWLNGSDSRSGDGPQTVVSNVPSSLQDTVVLTGDSVDTDPFDNYFQGMA